MLKTDYKDALFDGQRRYRMVQNEDGTYNLPDVTAYTQIGDKFGANEVNGISKAINRIDRIVEVSLPHTGWGTSAPYSQRVAVPGLKVTDSPHLLLYAPKTLSAAETKLRIKYTAMVTDGEPEDGYMTFYCGIKKPDGDFVVQLEGVSVDG